MRAQLGNVSGPLSVQPPTLVGSGEGFGPQALGDEPAVSGDCRAVCLRLSRKGEALQATDLSLQRGMHNSPMNSQSADLLERLGGIIEMGQLIASNTTH
jgi:hypothetical protein